MAGLNNVCNIEKVLSNGTAKSKKFGVDLEIIVSEGYRPEIVWTIGAIFLW
jgi:hypothetical protein